MSERIDVVLDRLIRSKQLRRDAAAYARDPTTADEIELAEIALELDLDDDDVDYEALCGEPR